MTAWVRAGGLGLALCLALGCTNGEYSVRVAFPDDPVLRSRVPCLDVRILSGGCAGDGRAEGGLRQWRMCRGALAEGDLSGSLSPGIYGFAASGASTVGCVAVSGCTEVMLDGEGGEVVAIELTENLACCEPGSERVEVEDVCCGGSRTRTCQEDGAWGDLPPGDCEMGNINTCFPGERTVETSGGGCSETTIVERTCSSACEWEVTDSRFEPPTRSCGPREECQNGRCRAV